MSISVIKAFQQLLDKEDLSVNEARGLFSDAFGYLSSINADFNDQSFVTHFQTLVTSEIDLQRLCSIALCGLITDHDCRVTTWSNLVQTLDGLKRMRNIVKSAYAGAKKIFIDQGVIMKYGKTSATKSKGIFQKRKLIGVALEIGKKIEDLSEKEISVSFTDAELKAAAGEDAEMLELLKLLVHTNGCDAYDAETMAAGIDVNPLLIPSEIPYRHPSQVGNSGWWQVKDIKWWAGLYALNRTVAPTGIDPDIYAILRMEAVKLGWIGEFSKIVVATPPADYMAKFKAGLKAHKDNLRRYRITAWVVPLLCEIRFRQTGHHYLSGNQVDYTKWYKDMLKVCLLDGYGDVLPPSVLFHDVFHWIGVARVWDVVSYQMDLPNVPDAIKIRHNTAPAGSAIISVACAILDTIGSKEVKSDLQEWDKIDYNNLLTVCANIKNDPRAYHKAWFAYHVEALSEDDRKAWELAIDNARKLAPILDAWVSVMLPTSTLANSKCLSKWVDVDPYLRRKCINYYKDLKGEAVSSFKSILNSMTEKEEARNKIRRSHAEKLRALSDKLAQELALHDGNETEYRREFKEAKVLADATFAAALTELDSS